jgi:hypothetical protein
VSIASGWVSGRGQRPRPFRAGIGRERGECRTTRSGRPACHRSHTVEVLLADSVDEKVDQPGDVGLGLVDQVRRRLLGQWRLGHGRYERHDLDAEARIGGFDQALKRLNKELAGQRSRTRIIIATRPFQSMES